MGSHWSILLQFGQNCPDQLFAQLHSPLIERVYVPDHALYKYLVFVQGEERPQGFGIQLPEQDGGSGMVTGENLVRQQFLQRFCCHSLSCQFSTDFVCVLAAHQRFGLGKEICQQQAMMIADGIVALAGRQEICRDGLRTLVQ